MARNGSVRAPRRDRVPILEVRSDAHDSLCPGMAVPFLFERGMHVHAVKGDAECKCWIDPDGFDITEEFEYNCTPRLRREVRRIIFEHFDQIAAAWREHFGGGRGE